MKKFITFLTVAFVLFVGTVTSDIQTKHSFLKMPAMPEFIDVPVEIEGKVEL